MGRTVPAVTRARRAAASRLAALGVCAAIVAGAGCSKSTASTTDAAAPDDKVYGGARPVRYFRVPAGYDPKTPAPLVMVLHGYGAGGIVQAAYFMLANIADDKGFFIVAPDGTV